MSLGKVGFFPPDPPPPARFNRPINFRAAIISLSVAFSEFKIPVPFDGQYHDSKSSIAVKRNEERSDRRSTAQFKELQVRREGCRGECETHHARHSTEEPGPARNDRQRRGHAGRCNARCFDGRDHLVLRYSWSLRTIDREGNST